MKANLDLIKREIIIFDEFGEIISTIEIEKDIKISDLCDYWNSFKYKNKMYDLNLFLVNGKFYLTAYELDKLNNTNVSKYIKIDLTINNRKKVKKLNLPSNFFNYLCGVE